MPFQKGQGQRWILLGVLVLAGPVGLFTWGVPEQAGCGGAPGDDAWLESTYLRSTQGTRQPREKNSDLVICQVFGNAGKIVSCPIQVVGDSQKTSPIALQFDSKTSHTGLEFVGAGCPSKPCSALPTGQSVYHKTNAARKTTRFVLVSLTHPKSFRHGNSPGKTLRVPNLMTLYYRLKVNIDKSRPETVSLKNIVVTGSNLETLNSQMVGGTIQFSAGTKGKPILGRK